MNLKRISDMIYGSATIYMGIIGYGAARLGDTDIAVFMVCFLIFMWGMLVDERKIKKLESKVREQESVLLRTEYIRNKMLEEGLWW